MLTREHTRASLKHQAVGSGAAAEARSTPSPPPSARLSTFSPGCAESAGLPKRVFDVDMQHSLDHGRARECRSSLQAI